MSSPNENKDAHEKVSAFPDEASIEKGKESAKDMQKRMEEQTKEDLRKVEESEVEIDVKPNKT